jgi:hypothetical protein
VCADVGKNEGDRGESRGCISEVGDVCACWLGFWGLGGMLVGMKVSEGILRGLFEGRKTKSTP